MRKLFILITAIVFGLIVNAFTVRDCITVYLVYNSGAQNVKSNYTELSSQTIREGTEVLAWIKVCVQGGIITEAIFNCVFEELDTTNDSANSLNDETEKTIVIECDIEMVVQLEKKSA